MQFLTNTIRLMRFQVFRPRPDDSLSPICARFPGQEIIGLSLGKRLRLYTIRVDSGGNHKILEVLSVSCDHFPETVIPDSAHAKLRELAKKQYAVVTISDASKVTIKTQTGLSQDSEEACLISMSADPKSGLTTADPSSAWRIIHGNKASSLVCSVKKDLISKIEEELSAFRIEMVRCSLSVLGAFNVLFADNRVVSKEYIPVVIDSGCAYAAPPLKNKPWGDIRKLENCIGTYFTEDSEKCSKWLLSTIVSKSEQSGGPSKILVFDLCNSGDLAFDSSLEIEYFVDPSKNKHPDIEIAATC